MTTTQPEVRYALPYVSHLKITKKANLQVVYGKDQQGNDAQGLMMNQPSITAEVTMYIISFDAEGNPLSEKAFSTPYTFSSRNYLQDILAQIALIANPTQNVLATKKACEDRLAKEKLWLEDVLAAANVPTLEGLWSEAFSEACDKFPLWKEPTTPIGGVQTFIRQLEWDARLSYESSKSVTVTMGVYSTAECLEAQPERKTLTFEDGATKRQRLAQLAQLDQIIADRTEALAIIDAVKVAKALPPGQARTDALAALNQNIVNQPDIDAFRVQVAQEKTSYVQQKTQMANVTYGAIADLLALPSIASSIKPLVVDGVIATLKDNIPEWANLDMDLVGARFAFPSVE